MSMEARQRCWQQAGLRRGIRHSRLPFNWLVSLLSGVVFWVGVNFQDNLEAQVFRQRQPPSPSLSPSPSSANTGIVDARTRANPGSNPRAVQPGQHQVATKHFLVMAPDPVLAAKVAQEAERFRKELAIEWLGRELPDWQDKCPIVVELGMHAGGETSFEFVFEDDFRGFPRHWNMKIFGPPDRLLDSVLPHEVTHTIFATHFGRPLPRWADEGACTIVEHESERAKNHQMLMEFLQTNRGIPFNRMFEMKQYPHDILPLYAQGYSLSKFLILQKGKREFLNFIESGMRAEQNAPVLPAWDQTIENIYGYRDLSELQIAWIQWVRSGSREIPATSLAATQREQPRQSPARLANQSDDISRVPRQPADLLSENSPIKADSVLNGAISRVNFEHPANDEVNSTMESQSGGWYTRQSRGERVLLNRTDRVEWTESNQHDSNSGDTVRSLLRLDEAGVRSNADTSYPGKAGPTIWR